MADTKPETEAMTPELDAYYWARYERAAVGGEKRLAKAEAALRAALSPKPVEVAPEMEIVKRIDFSVDGEALPPSAFGRTDPATGKWVPHVSVAPDDEALIDNLRDGLTDETYNYRGQMRRYSDDLEALRRRIAGLRHIEWLMNYGGIIEVAIRNPNVKSYMEVWEKRAETTESALSSMEDDRNVWKASAERAHAALAACRGKTIEECADLAEQFEDEMGHGQAQKAADAIRAEGK